MARLQILELPEGADDNRPPFVLVIDQALPERHVLVSGEVRVRSEWDTLAEAIGARGVIVTPETIDIPANDLTLTNVQEAADGNIIRLRVEPDLEGFTEKVLDEVARAQAAAKAAHRA